MGFRKILICVFAVCMASVLPAQESGDVKTYNLGEKEVVDINSKDYTADVKINSKIEKKDILTEEPKINVKEEKINILKELKIKEVKLDSIEEKNDLTYNIFIYPEPNVIVKNETKSERDHTNYIIFGAGGYQRLDSFKYIIDYTKEDREKEIKYFLHLGRDIKGEYRFNSDRSLDNYFGKIWYKNMDLSLSHVITDEKLPGSGSVPEGTVTSWRKDKVTNLEFNYGIDEKLKFGTELYSKEVKSTGTPSKREYSNIYYSLYGTYETVIDTPDLKNFIDYKGIYYIDKIDSAKLGSESTNVLRLEAKDRVKLLKDETVDVNGAVLVEFVNKTNATEVNAALDISVDKYLNKEVTLNAKIVKEKKNARIKDIEESYIYDYDILSPAGLLNEDMLKVEAGAYYSNRQLSGTAKLRHISSMNKIIFEEDSVSIASETPVYAKNYTGGANWQEIEIGAGYSLDKLRFDGNMSFNNNTILSFLPQSRVNIAAMYKDTRHEGKLELKYFGDMYGKEKKVNRLNGYLTADASYKYQVNDTLDILFSMKNILDTKYNYKTDYKGESRKITIEVKINY